MTVECPVCMVFDKGWRSAGVFTRLRSVDELSALHILRLVSLQGKVELSGTKASPSGRTCLGVATSQQVWLSVAQVTVPHPPGWGGIRQRNLAHPSDELGNGILCD